jgi:hypothetical protein
MTNAILKRLARKGWITVKKINSRNIQYAVTLAGINEILRRSYRYFKRTIKNIVYYKDTLETLIQKAWSLDNTTVLLIGASDLDFIVEHACRRCGLRFLKTGDKGLEAADEHTFVIFAENIRVPAVSGGDVKSALNEPDKNAFYLSQMAPATLQNSRRNTRQFSPRNRTAP